MRNNENNNPAKTPRLYRINAGSCNGCDVELATTAVLPRFDIRKYGCAYCQEPDLADIVLISGPLTVKMRDKVLRQYEEIPEPKVVVAIGVCPVSGGVFRDSYAIEKPLDAYIPVDVNVPGCPPRPQAIIEGIRKAREIWLTKG